MRPALSRVDDWPVLDLLRGDPARTQAWSERLGLAGLIHCLGVIVIGAGLYGAAVGCWRSPLQALFVAIKLPLILLLTALGNALLNGMLAPLLGANLGIRQSCQAILISFSIAAAILGAFSPLVAFLVWNSPPVSSNFSVSGGTYSFIMLVHVGLIAFAGVAANIRLVQWLRHRSRTPAAALRVLLGWLAGNLFLGSQISWVLRPFIGAPDLAVQFLRPSPFYGSFCETVLQSLMRVLNIQ